MIICSNIFSSLKFGGLYVLETYPFIIGCQICWHIIVHSILLFFFLFLQCWLIFILFHFLFYLGSLSFLLGEPGQRFLNFVYPLKNKLLVLLIFFYFFLKKSLLISSMLFIILFLLILGFVYPSFSNSFRLGCLRFFLFFEEVLYHEILKTAFAVSHRLCMGCVFIFICLKVVFNFLFDYLTDH